ncbi:hypothetical protein LXL04_021188 [Taraxacum kok-saghyz]
MNVMVSYTERERSVPAFEMESEEACKRGEELVKIEAGVGGMARFGSVSDFDQCIALCDFSCFNTADTQFASAKMKDDSTVVVDDAVEVYGREEDRCLCFYAATIVSLFETDVEVRFADLKTEGNKPIVEKIGLEYIRPRPVNVSFDFKCGDAINVWIKDRWWLGKFVARVRRSQAVCLIFKAEREETGPQFQKQIYYENESRTCPVPSSHKDQATIRTRPMHPKHPQVDSCQPKTKDMVLYDHEARN